MTERCSGDREESQLGWQLENDAALRRYWILKLNLESDPSESVGSGGCALREQQGQAAR